MNSKLLASLLWLIFVSSNCLANIIKVSASEFPNFSQADGKGIYFSILEQVFPEHQLEFETSSFKFAVELFEHRKVDVVVAVYPHEVRNGHIPTWILDTDWPVEAYYLRRRFMRPPDIINNTELSVGWLDGYGFKKLLPNLKHTIGVRSRQTGFDLLRLERLDVFLDHKMNNNHQSTFLYGSFEALPGKPLYVAFQNTERGIELAKQYDLMMPKLRERGVLKSLYGDVYLRSGLADFIVPISTSK